MRRRTKKVNEIVDAAIPMPANATPQQAQQAQQVLADRKSVKEAASTVVGVASVAATGGTNQQMATGGNIALLADQNNRQLHQTEKDRIKALAGNNPKREADLTAAACAMVRCADGVQTVCRRCA